MGAHRKMKLSIGIALFAALAVSNAACAGEVPRRCLFVSVIQEPQVLSSREAIGGLIDFSKKAGIEALFVQVYYANRAWFRSAGADDAPYRECLASIGEDPVALLIKQAHGAGIKVHAWLNILSLGGNKDAHIIRKYGIDILTRNREEKRSLEDYRIDSQYFLEPGDPRVRAELVAVVGEVLGGYPELDGIQFDYIRYPDMHPAYGHTASNVGRFKTATGSDRCDECDGAWKDWKRAQVTEVLEALVTRARELNPGIAVSTTGCMPYQRALYEAFQDWPSWLDKEIVAFVTVMSYSPYPAEFERWIARAKSETKYPERIIVGLGAYRLAGAPGIFGNELRFCEGSGCGGVAVFHYGSLVENPELGRILAGSNNNKEEPS